MQMTTNKTPLSEKAFDKGTAFATDNRTWAALLWVAACYTTALFVRQLGIPMEYATVIGVLIQGIVSKIEQTVWHGTYSIIGIVVLIADVYINSAGVWPWIRDNFKNTDAWKMAADISKDAAPPHLLFLLGLAVVIGFILARGPEYLWNWKATK